ncbi:DUF1302 domain-containing protein [Pseudomonas gingeri]|uniref:DUF1302 domain-containing protein n=1 Tax=Pseudomonas gingeri TaxID=117681 RepID=UPI0015A2FA3E|nr:DUF1302 domain-containing protein [Pseudomonas gingeri]NWD66932.1 DUF1302 domain-containing protein [Pseudomonas gingeri]
MMKVRTAVLFPLIGIVLSYSILSCHASAHDFVLDDTDVIGSWNATSTFGTGIRMQNADKTLVGRSFGSDGKSKGGVGTDVADDGDLNFKKGEAYSTVLKVVGDVDLKYQNYGVFLRGKAWYDFTLNNKRVAQGNSPNGIQGNSRLSDDGFTSADSFNNVELLDAYVYGDWSIGSSNLNLRLGRQVVNWGESLFVQGVNQVNPSDLTAMRRPGADVKESLIPVNMLYANLAFNNGFSIESFYQLEWRRTQTDPCGTFFAGSDIGLDRSCNSVTTNAFYSGLAAGALPASAASWYNDQFHAQNGLLLPRTADQDPSNGGQWGLAIHQFIEPVNSDIGLYYMNIHARTPMLSVTNWDSRALATPDPALIAAGAPVSVAQAANALKTITYHWDYPSNIKVMGMSLSTTLGGWAVGSELSHVQGMPVQLNTSDLFAAVTRHTGPLAARIEDAAPGAALRGYDLLNKTQFQLNAIQAFPGILGATSVSLAGEVAVSHADNLPPLSTARYLRGLQYGFSTEGYGGGCAAATDPLVGNPDGCTNKGFATRTAWGYRLNGQLNYNVWPGVTMSPSVSWSHDVKGYSIDSQFVEDRKIIVMGLAANYLQKYFAQISYTSWLSDAKFDVSNDRDFLNLTAGMTF